MAANSKAPPILIDLVDSDDEEVQIRRPPPTQTEDVKDPDLLGVDNEALLGNL